MRESFKPYRRPGPSPWRNVRLGWAGTLAPSRKRAFEMRRLASSSGPPTGASAVRLDSGHRPMPCGLGRRRLQYKTQARAIPVAAWQDGQIRASGRPHAPCARGRRAGRAKPSPKGAVRLGVPSRGKLHGVATDARVRSRCDVLRAAAAPPMGARAMLQRSDRRGPTSRAMGEGECAVGGASGPHGK